MLPLYRITWHWKNLKRLTVIVEVVEPSEFIDAGEAERLIESAVGVVGIGVVPVSLLPPQATRLQNRARKISSNNGRDNFA